VQVLWIALGHQHAGLRHHVADEIDLLCTGRGVEQRVPHSVDLPGHQRGEQTGPCAGVELHLDAGAGEHRAGEVGVQPDQVLEVVRVAAAEGRPLTVLANAHRPAG
jgi:hypothetical protein